MNQTIIADRYAEALFALAQEDDQVDAYGEALADFDDLLTQTPELKQLLFHPVVKMADKKQVLAKLLTGKIPTPVMNFFYLLVDKKRETFVPQINAAYKELLNTLHKTVVAEVVTSINLRKDTEKILKKQLENYLEQQVIMECRVDPTILGGVTVKVGDRLIDASLNTQLRELAQTLM